MFYDHKDSVNAFLSRKSQILHGYRITSVKDIRYGTPHTHLKANGEREREIALSRIQLSFLSFILSPFHL